MKLLLLVLALCAVAQSGIVTDGFLHRVNNLDRRNMQASTDCTDSLSDHTILALHGSRDAVEEMIVLDTYWDNAFVEDCAEDTAADPPTVSMQVNLLTGNFQHTSPTDLTAEQQVEFPNVADSGTEWQCVEYTDTSGVTTKDQDGQPILEDDGSPVTSKSRCEYKMMMTFFDDEDNQDVVTSNAQNAINAYEEQCVFLQHSFWMAFAGIDTLLSWVDYSLCVKTYLNVQIATTGQRDVVPREIIATCDGCVVETTLEADCVYTDGEWAPLTTYGSDASDNTLQALQEVNIVCTLKSETSNRLMVAKSVHFSFTVKCAEEDRADCTQVPLTKWFEFMHEDSNGQRNAPSGGFGDKDTARPYPTMFEWDDDTKALRITVGFAPGEVWDLYYSVQLFMSLSDGSWLQGQLGDQCEQIGRCGRRRERRMLQDEDQAVQIYEMEGLNPSEGNEEFTGEEVNPMDALEGASGVAEVTDTGDGDDDAVDGEAAGGWYKLPLLLSVLLLSWLKYL